MSIISLLIYSVPVKIKVGNPTKHDRDLNKPDEYNRETTESRSIERRNRWYLAEEPAWKE
jgi:hypothetical protein